MIPHVSRPRPGAWALMPLAALPLAALLPVALLAGAGVALLARPARGVRRQDVAGRVFVVTGASSGVGRGVAARLGALGAHVVLAARRAEVLEEVAAGIRQAGGQALVVPTDVAEADAVVALAEAAVARFGRVDVWVNNAGIGALGRFEDIATEDHGRIVDVNLKGAIFGSHAALALFRAQGGQGVLLNVGSVESRIPMPYHATYAATKHAILGLGRALRQELRLAGARGTRVVTIMPWALDTPWWNVAGNHTGRAPRMLPMDGPGQTVEAILQAAVAPRGDVAVGFKAQASVLAHQVAPGLVERLAADAMHTVQLELAPPAPDRAGALHEPPAQQTPVQGGVRARMQREDTAQA